MKELVEQMLDDIRRMTKIPSFAELYDACNLLHDELNRPMRLAITGVIKTGKSTLLNALLGKYIVPTAVRVLTYNINWFHHVSTSPQHGQELVVVHYLNGSNQEMPLARLSDFVAINGDNKNILDDIDWVDVYLDHPLLQKFDLIDTPGLDSLLGDDSKHTRDLLTSDINRPDAIIYLVSKEFRSTDICAVESFRSKTGLMSGINTVAALTRVDELNNHYSDAQNIIDSNLKCHAEIRYYFSDVFALAALPAEASSVLTSSDIEKIRQVSQYVAIDNFITDKSSFEETLPILTKEERVYLCSILSIDGIRLCVNYLRESPNATSEELSGYLYKFSKVEDVKNYICERFGDRALYFKTKRVVSGLKEAYRKIEPTLKIYADLLKLREIQQKTDLVEQQIEQYYASYFILDDFYNYSDYFVEREWTRARRVLGDFGNDILCRLDLPSETDTQDLLKQLRLEKSYWINVSSDLSLFGNEIGALKARTIANIVSNLNT